MYYKAVYILCVCNPSDNTYEKKQSHDDDILHQGILYMNTYCMCNYAVHGNINEHVTN